MTIAVDLGRKATKPKPSEGEQDNPIVHVSLHLLSYSDCIYIYIIYF